MRLSKADAPMILGFGHKLRSGKSECAQAIAEHAKEDYAVLRTSFARALRREVYTAISTIKGDELSIADKVKEMCLMCGVDYDPEAPRSVEYPYGKQRALYQFYGTEFRRGENPFYWIEAIEQEIIKEKSQVVIIDDVRFPNEMFWIRSLGGYVVKVDRPDFVPDPAIAQHASETSLDGYTFDYTLTSQEGNVLQLCRDAVDLFDTLVKRWSGAECAEFFQSLPQELVSQES